MANLALVFDLLARDNASGPFRNVGNAAERAGSQTSKFGTAVSGAMKLAGGALLGAGLVQGFKALYEAADESRKIGALTGAVIKSTGGAANVSAKQVSNLAASIAAKTGIDDEAIQSGENLLLTFTNVRNEVGKGNDIFNQATGIITDMSVALGQDTSSSAIQLGKALNDPIKGVTALQRVGVSFTASQKDQIRTLVESGKTLDAQKIILAELGKEFGGAAEAASTPLGRLQVTIGNLAEQVGGYLTPAVDEAAAFLDDKLMPALSDAGAVANSTVVPAVKAVASGVEFLVDTFNDLPGPLKIGVVALGAVAALKGPVTGAIETIALRALYLGDAFKAASGSAGLLKAAGSGLLSFFGGPVGLAVAGVAASFALLSSATEDNEEVTSRAAGAQRTLADALRESKGAIDDNVRAAAAKSLQDAGVLDVAERAGVSLSRVTDAVLGNKAAYDEVSGALKEYAGMRSFAAAFEEHGEETLHKQADAAHLAESDFTKLAGTLGQTATQQQQLTSATEVGATTQQTFAQQTDAARTELDAAKQAIDDYKLSLDVLTGDTVSMIQVEAQWGDAVRAGHDAIKGLDGSVLNADGTLNAFSEAGGKASDVLVDFRSVANLMTATMKEQGATTEEVTKREGELRASFIKTAGEMGITGENAERLADQILGIPGQRNTTVTADTAPAEAAIKRFMDQRRTITIGTRTVTARVGTTYQDAGGGYWTGGYTGPGGKFDYAGPAHKGEVIWSQEDVAAHGGPSRVDALRRARGYADGGWVGGSKLGSMRIPTMANTSGLAAGLNAAANAAASAMEPNYSGSATAGSGALVAFGRLLQRMGARVSEHPAFGGVTRGAHVRNSKHYSGRAIDVNTRAGTSSLEQRELDPMMAMARRAGFQVIWRAPGHYNHGHVASYQTGTDYVPKTGLAYLHKGERVVPAEQNAALGGPLDLSDATIEKLAVAMIRGADSVVGGALVAVHNRTAY